MAPGHEKMRESEINIKRNGESTKHDYMYSTRKLNQLMKENDRKYQDMKSDYEKERQKVLGYKVRLRKRKI